MEAEGWAKLIQSSWSDIFTIYFGKRAKCLVNFRCRQILTRSTPFDLLNTVKALSGLSFFFFNFLLFSQ